MKTNLNQMKEDYLKLQASDALKERISQSMKTSQPIEISPKRTSPKRNKWTAFGSIAAVLAITFVLSLNLMPAFAASLSQIPGLEGIVRVLTFGRYAIHDGGYQATIETPQIEGLLDSALQDKLNADFKENAIAVIAAFEADMKALKAAYPNETVNMGIDSGYLVKTDNDRYLAIDVYMVNTVGSSSTTHKFYTIDKKTQKQVTLPSLFANGADYQTPINAFLIEEMKRQNTAGTNFYWVDDPTFGPFAGISPDQNFYINNDHQLVICFDKYAVGPGSSGSPEFVIPDSVLAGIRR